MEFSLGYDLVAWQNYGIKKKIVTDISVGTNSHMLINGASGSGKTYLQSQIFAKLAQADTESVFYFADYKQDDSYEHLRSQARYFGYEDTLKALDIVYSTMKARIAGEDKTRHQVTLIWDEYAANILALYNEEKKKAEEIMRKVSEILMLARSVCVRLIVSCQIAYASSFPQGSRLNFGVICILGGFNKGIYEMLMPEYMDKVKQRVQQRDFGKGEGSILLQSSELHFIKVGEVADMAKMERTCKFALN